MAAIDLRSDHAPAPRSAQLTSKQIVAVIVCGIVLWFAAAVSVHALRSFGLLEGAANAVLFVLAIPVSAAAVWLVGRVTGASGPQLPPAIAIGTAAAAFCDGIAITWFPALYGGVGDGLSDGAAFVLWGIGCFLASAAIIGRAQEIAALEPGA